MLYECVVLLIVIAAPTYDNVVIFMIANTRRIESHGGWKSEREKDLCLVSSVDIGE